MLGLLAARAAYKILMPTMSVLNLKKSSREANLKYNNYNFLFSLPICTRHLHRLLQSAPLLL